MEDSAIDGESEGFNSSTEVVIVEHVDGDRPKRYLNSIKGDYDAIICPVIDKIEFHSVLDFGVSGKIVVGFGKSDTRNREVMDPKEVISTTEEVVCGGGIAGDDP
jgi:hypothetical protein